MWDSIKGWAIALAAALTAIGGFLIISRKAQVDAGKTPDKTVKAKEEVAALEDQKSVTAGQILEKQAQADAVEKQIESNKAIIEGISTQVASMNPSDVDAELKKRGLL